MSEQGLGMVYAKTLRIVHPHSLQHINHFLAFDLLGNGLDSHFLRNAGDRFHHAQINFIDIDILHQRSVYLEEINRQ